MFSLALIIEYDGTNFFGWQFQPNARSVQDELQKAWNKITKTNINFVGSGRTDTGVHAYAQVASAYPVDLIIPQNKLAIAINSVLPNDIYVKKAVYLDFKFNARFDAKFREYHYFITKHYSVFNRNFITNYKLPFDEDKLFEISEIFLGKNDFTTFSKINNDIINNVCEVTISKWEKTQDSILVYKIQSNHFLYGMVRAIVGVMLDYARGKRSKEEILEALQSKDRSLASPFAPPTGLYLAKVYYDDKINSLIY